MNHANYWLRGTLAIAIAVGVFVVVASASERGETHDDDRARAAKLVDQGEIRPLNEVLDRAQAVRPGKVLEVELEDEGVGDYYEIEILDQEGTLWELKFDAASGELIEEEQER
jgi:uncharacterized membrane protein YkoI